MKRTNDEDKNLKSPQETISVQEFARELQLEVVFEGRNQITLSSISLSRPGLQLAGYFKYFDHKRVQIIGNAEYAYINAMPESARQRNLERLFKADIPCMIIARNLPILDDILELAKKYNCPLFRSKHVTTVLSQELTIYQSELLAPTKVVHAVLVEVFGVGVLIKGKSGIGKSEIALELITRGHRLVSDDSVVIKNHGDKLMGKAPKNIQYYMEVRGLGIINIQKMYGPGAIRPQKSIDMVVELSKLSDGQSYERLGDVQSEIEILGIKIPKLSIPVSPGRNTPVVIETAARKFRLDQEGYDATKELIERTFAQNLKN